MANKVIKLRIYPNADQINTIEQTFGTLRFLYNQYLTYNMQLYADYLEGKDDKRFMGHMEFYKEVYPVLKEKYPWISETSNKDARQYILDLAENSFKKFFKGKAKHPKLKSKKKNPVMVYEFRKNGVRFDVPHMIWVPILRYVKFADKGYYRKGVLNENLNITSGRIIKDRYGRYFVSLIIEYEPSTVEYYKTEGLGIDLGVKTYATVYNGDRCFKISHPWRNDSNTRLRFYQDKINNLMRMVSNKIEINKKNGGKPATIYHSHNIQKLWVKIKKYYKKINDYMDDFIKKVCNTFVVIAKPRWIVIENLNIKDMLTESKISTKMNDMISKSRWYQFKTILTSMAIAYGCEIVKADKYFPSSKTCHVCGHVNKIKLKDRTITCKHCNSTYDRDENAAINLYNYRTKIL